MKQKSVEKINKDLNRLVRKAAEKAIRKYAKKHDLIITKRQLDCRLSGVSVVMTSVYHDPLGYPSSAQDEEKLLEILTKRKESRLNLSGKEDEENLFG